MLRTLSVSAALAAVVASVNAAPARRNNDGKGDYNQYYNIEGHRGARGEGAIFGVAATLVPIVY
jgi:hypothetical protein